MGLFSGGRRLWRPSQFEWPIRLHSQYSLARSGTWLTGAGRVLRGSAIAATNDPRIVAALLLVASAGLAIEMAASFK